MPTDNAPLDPAALEAALQSAGDPWEMGETSLATARTEDLELRLGLQVTADELAVLEAAEALSRSPDWAAMLQLSMVPAAVANAPSSFDLRNVAGVDYTTPIHDQGNCGSCVAFGTVAAMEGVVRFTNRDPKLKVDLSEADLFYCLGAQEGSANCRDGWRPEKALQMVKKAGVAVEHCYPYTDQQQKCGGDAQCKKDNHAEISEWESIKGNPALIKHYVSSYGAVIAGMYCYEDFRYYKSGVYRHVAGDYKGGHCVTLIGYNDKAQYWLGKNSWGTGWGEGGFFRIAYGQCKIESLATCGVRGVKLNIKAGARPQFATT